MKFSALVTIMVCFSLFHLVLGLGSMKHITAHAVFCHFLALAVVLSISYYIFTNFSNKDKWGVIIPMDGLVIETNGAFWPAMNSVLSQCGVESTATDPRVLEALTGLSTYLVACKLKELFNLTLSPENLADLINKEILKNLASRTVEVVGFRDFYAQLEHRKIKVAVKTSTAVEQMDVLEKRFGLSNMLSGRLYCEPKIGQETAAEEQRLLALAKKLDVQPYHCIVICKKPNSQSTVKNIGMHSVCVDYHKTTGPDGEVIAHLKPFSDILVEIDNITKK